MKNEQTVESGRFQRTPGKYLEDVTKGGKVFITRYGRLIAELRPVEQSEEEAAKKGKEDETE